MPAVFTCSSLSLDNRQNPSGDPPRLTQDPTSLPSTGVVPCPCAAGFGEAPWRGPTHRKAVQLLPFLSFGRAHSSSTTWPFFHPPPPTSHRPPPSITTRRPPAPPSPPPSTPLAAPSIGGDHQLFSPETSPASRRQSLRLLSIASASSQSDIFLPQMPRLAAATLPLL